MLNRKGRCLAAPGETEFLQDMADMVTSRLLTHKERLSNLLIRIATRY